MLQAGIEPAAIFLSRLLKPSGVDDEPSPFDNGPRDVTCFSDLPMKRTLVFVLLAAAAAFPGDRPAVPQCFKIHALIRADGEHYWADWTNACPYTIDSVYVMIGFRDKSRKRLGDGVWGLHFITQGAHRVTRFSTPRGVDGFEFVDIRKVTTDSTEALR